MHSDDVMYQYFEKGSRGDIMFCTNMLNLIINTRSWREKKSNYTYWDTDNLYGRTMPKMSSYHTDNFKF